MDARKFWTMCRLHDWFYMMSDDPGVYREGAESLSNLEHIMRGKPELMAIYEAWREHSFGTGPVPAEPALDET